MKQLLFLSCFLLFGIQETLAQWRKVELPAGIKLVNFQWANKDTAYLIANGNNKNQLYVTYDQCKTWVKVQDRSQFVVGQWLTGKHGYFIGLETFDGGKTSVKNSTPLKSNGSIFFWTPHRGIVGGEVALTEDAGKSWNVISNPLIFMSQSKVPAFSLDTLIGYGYGRKNFRFFPYKTTDGGLTWDSTDLEYNIGPKQFFAPELGYSIYKKTIYKTIDSAKSWFFAGKGIDLNGNDTAVAFYFTDSLTGYVGTYTKMYKTLDGGRNWILQWKTNTPHDMGIYGSTTLMTFAPDDDQVGQLSWSYMSGDKWGFYVTTNGGGMKTEAKPKPHIVVDDPVCLDEPFSLHDTTTADQGMTYFWDFGDGNTSDNPQPTHTYRKRGKYIIKLTVTSFPHEYTAEDSIEVVVTTEAKFGFTSNCVGAPVSFSDSSIYKEGAKSVIRWDFGDNTPIVSGNKNPTHTYNAAGVYNVTLSIDDGTCIHHTSKQVKVYDYAIADFWQFGNACEGAEIKFNNVTKTTNEVSYLWDFGDKTATSALTDPTHVYKETGTYIVTLKAKTFDCVTTKTDTIEVYPKPDADFYFEHDKYSTKNRPILIFYAKDTTAKYYHWDVAELGWNMGGRKSATVNFYSDTIIYTVCLSVTSENGCGAKLCKQIDFSTGIKNPVQDLNTFHTYPNPFSSHANLEYSVDKKCLSKIVLQDLNGKEVIRIKPAGMIAAGKHSLSFDGSKLSPGLYILKIITDDKVYTQRVEKMR